MEYNRNNNSYSSIIRVILNAMSYKTMNIIFSIHTILVIRGAFVPDGCCGDF